MIIGFSNPNGLTNTDGKKYLPHSIGFEIECGLNNDYTELEHTNARKALIGNMDNTGHSNVENRFRIPAGLDGIKALFEISNYCKKYLTLNEGSGIHYHVDSPWLENFDRSKMMQIIEIIEPQILEELDKWNYKGSKNKRHIEINSKFNWVNVRTGLKTIEYRIGEMTFDFQLLLKRMSHLCVLNDIIESAYKSAWSVSTLRKLNNRLRELNEANIKDGTIEGLTDNAIKSILKSRYVRTN